MAADQSETVLSPSQAFFEAATGLGLSEGPLWTADAELFAVLPVGSPDGMALDAGGYLHVAAPDGDRIVVFDPDGGLAEQIELGRSFPTNCAFVGPDLDRLALTAAKGGRVVLIERPRPGLALDPGPDRSREQG